LNSKHEILIAILILFLVILLLFIGFGDKGLADLYNLKQERDNLIAANAKLKRENKVLKRVIKRLKDKDPALIEKLAREELGMVRRDEHIYVRRKPTGR